MNMVVEDSVYSKVRMDRYAETKSGRLEGLLNVSRFPLEGIDYLEGAPKRR